MPTHHFKSIADIVQTVANKHLPEGDTQANSEQFERLYSCWHRCADELLAENVKPARLDETVLIVTTHSPVWANKMRYSVKKTMAKLHQHGFKQIQSIKIRVNPRLNP